MKKTSVGAYGVELCKKKKTGRRPGVTIQVHFERR